jgi:hypothetical protein
VVLNKGDGIVRLVHYTTQDYLETLFPKLDANTFIAKASMKYLDFAVDLSSPSEEVKEYASDPYSYQYMSSWTTLEILDKKYELAAYATKYVGVQVREGDEKALSRDVLVFLSAQERRATSYFNAFLQQQTFGISQLHFLSIYGLSCVCGAYLIEHTRPDSLSATP